MKSGQTQDASQLGACASGNAKELFRVRFQQSLRHCLERRFSVAECFGLIWLETLEEVALTDTEQADMYAELIYWAKHRLFREVMHANSPNLFTDNPKQAGISPDSSRKD